MGATEAMDPTVWQTVQKCPFQKPKAPLPEDTKVSLLNLKVSFSHNCCVPFLNARLVPKQCLQSWLSMKMTASIVSQQSLSMEQTLLLYVNVSGSNATGNRSGHIVTGP